MLKNVKNVIRDTGIIVLSILIAVILMKTGVLQELFISTRDMNFLNSFISGFFFTSVFTTAPAIAALAEISQINSLWGTALFGGLGAMCGDFIIFQFLRNHFSTHIFEMARMKGFGRRLKAHLKSRFFRWLTFLLGGLIIASPLPDELGLGLLGFSKTKTFPFLILSFVFNFIGILIVGLVARAIV